MLDKDLKLRNIKYYIIAIVINVIILYWVLDLKSADLKVPFVYGGDAFLTNLFIRSTIDHGWAYNNSYLGAPHGFSMYDFPLSESINFLLIKFIALFSSNSFVVMNVFYLLMFPIITLTSMLAMRQLHFSYSSSIVGSLLFSFIPYHFLRGEPHLFLSAYYTIPLITLVFIWVFNEWNIEHLYKNRLKKLFRDKKFLVSLFICLIVSSSGVYYAFFSCFFLIVVGIASSIHKKTIKRLFLPFLFICIISVGLLANILPSTVYHQVHGENTEVAKRHPSESEVYGFKISQLLLPVDGYRIDKIAELKDVYTRGTILNNENNMSLGAVGAIGFLSLLVVMLFLKNCWDRYELLYQLGILNLSAVLLSTIGGVGSLFAFIITPDIRAYNRISVFIAFFSILCFFYLFELVREKYENRKSANILYFAAMSFILIIGVLDQTNSSFRPLYEWNKSEYLSDTSFVGQIEAVLPEDSYIFQLPYVPFPENPPVHNMRDYELLRGYLNSTTLQWSYPTMKGREGDAWVKYTSSKPVNELLNSISFAGFSGIYIDRYGYADHGVELESQLIALLNQEPLESKNKRHLFYNLVDFNAKHKNQYTEEAWKSAVELNLHPILFDWANTTIESNAEYNWRWMKDEAVLKINNTSENNKMVEINMSLATGHNEFTKLEIESETFSDELMINATEQFYSAIITVPKGGSIIRFSSDAENVDAPTDPRELNFKVVNFTLEVIDAE